MTQLELKNLRFIHRILLVATVLLMMAEVGYVLMGVFNYVIAIVGALIILGYRFASYKLGKGKAWQQVALMVFPILVIFGPVLYTIIKLIAVGETALWLQLIVLLGFVLPILILLYTNRLLHQMINEANV